MADTKSIRDIVVIGAIAVGGYLLYNKFFKQKVMSPAEKEQAVGKLTQDSKKILIQAGESGDQGVSIPVKEPSVDKGKLILRATNPDGSITSYKVDPQDLGGAQRRAIEANRFTITKDGILKTTILPQGSKTISAPKTQFNAVVPSTLTPGKSLRTVSTPATATSPAMTTTYKGTATQIAVGRAVDTAKSVISKVSSLFSSSSKSLRR